MLFLPNTTTWRTLNAIEWEKASIVLERYKCQAIDGILHPSSQPLNDIYLMHISNFKYDKMAHVIGMGSW